MVRGSVMENTQSGFGEIGKYRLKGFLVDISTNGQCEIWFPYSLEIMYLLSPGVFLAVKNIRSLDSVEKARKREHYAILQVQSKSVIHFTIEDMRRMLQPRKMLEDFEHIQQDWNRTLQDPENDKLRIIAQAEITEGTLVCEKGVPTQFGAISEPILGEDVYLLTPAIVNAFINARLSQPGNGGVQIARHKLYSKVPICVDYDGMITRHFGIFGYTGAGKSNLVSTLLARIAHEDERRVRERSVPGLNLFIFDVNNEYIMLLMDQLVNRSDAYVVCLDEGVITGNMRNFMKGDLRYWDAAARDLIAGTTAPREIQKSEEYQICPLLAKRLLIQGKIRMLNPYYGGDETFDQVVGEMVSFVEELSVPGLGDQRKQQLLQIVVEEGQKLEGSKQPIINRLIEYVDALVTVGDRKLQEPVAVGLAKVLEFIKKRLDEIIERSSYVYGIGRNELMKICHDDQSSLVIFLASSENELRLFSGLFVRDIYQLRKNRGIIEPNVLFFFDEADLFMPGITTIDRADKEERRLLNVSAKACETLARRGRKYGLGLGFATQRTTHLNTNIMGQIGTYFVGRLPRQVDRDAIVNSFGSVESSVFTQTAMFGSGSWLVMSHTALARRVPVGIQAENGNERILAFLQRVIEKTKETVLIEGKKVKGKEESSVDKVNEQDVEAYFPVEAQPCSDEVVPEQPGPTPKTEAATGSSKEGSSNESDVEAESPGPSQPSDAGDEPANGEDNQGENGGREEEEQDPGQRKRRKEYLDYLEHLISTGEYTRDDLVEMVKERYPSVKESTIRQRITDSQNPKFTAFFPKVTEKTADGRYVFKEESLADKADHTWIKR